MAKLTGEMKEAIGKMGIFPVATSSKDGIPNVVPIGGVVIVSDDVLWIVDNYMKKTLENLKTNPRIALYVWGPEIKGCFQIKGHATIKTSGQEFVQMKAMINKNAPLLPARSLIIMKITEVFECQPGQNAGKRLL